MATKIGSLFATLRLDGTGFKREISRSRKELTNFTKHAKRAGAAIGGFLGVGSIASVGLLTKSTITYADTVAKTADKIGLSTKALQEWRYVADLSGVSANTLDIGIQRFGRRLGEAADGTGTLKDALRQMDVDIRNQDGTLRDVNEVFTEYLVKLGGIEDVTVRNSLAMKAFDTEGVALVNVAKNGAKAIEGMIKQANDLGIVLDDKLLRQAEQVNDQFTTFGTVMGVYAKKAVLELLPQIKDLMSTLINNREAIGGMVENFLGIGTALFRAAAGAAEFINQLGKGIGIKAAQIFDPNLEDKILNLLNRRDQILKSGSADYVARNRVYQKELDDIAEKLEGLRKQKKEYDDVLNSFTPTAQVNTDFTPPTFTPIALSTLKEQDKAAKKTTEAVKELTEAEKLHLELLARGRDVYADTRTPIEQLDAKIHDLNLLLREGAIDWDTYSRAVFNAEGEFEDTVDSVKDKIEATNDVAKDLGFTFSSAFEDAIVEGGKFSDLMKSLEKDIIRIIAREKITKPFASFITDSIGSGGSGGFLSNIFGSIFGGGKALGGPVAAGTPYLVGERGPEIFAPNTSGNIIPNDKISRGATIINVNVNGIRDEGGLRQSAGQVAAAVAHEMRRGQRNL